MESIFILSVMFVIALSACAPARSGRDVSSGEVCITDNLGHYCQDRNGNVGSGSTVPEPIANN